MSHSKNQKVPWLLFGLYLFTALVYLSVFFVNGNFTENTYLSFRRFEAIEDDSQILVDDTLAQGSNDAFFNPYLYYTLYPIWLLSSSPLSFIIAILLIASLLPLIVFAFLNQFEQSMTACALTSVLAAINPLLFLFIKNGFYIALLYPLATISFFYLFFLYENESSQLRKTLILIGLVSMLSLFTHLLFALCVFGLFLAFHVMEKKEFAQSKKELFLTISLLFLFVQYLIYYIFFAQTSFISIFSQSFIQSTVNLNFFNIFSQLIFPFLIVGLGSFYRSFRMRTNNLVLFSFCMLCVGITLFLLQINNAFVFLLYVYFAFVFCIPYMYRFLDTYWKDSKFEKKKNILATLFFTILISFAFIFGFMSIDFTQNRIVSQTDAQFYSFVKNEVAANSLFVLYPQEAEKFMFYTQQKTFADFTSSQTLQGKKRILTQSKIYATAFSSVANNVLAEYLSSDVSTYIVWRTAYTEFYGVKPTYFNSSCFPLFYENADLSIYAVNCTGGNK